MDYFQQLYSFWIRQTEKYEISDCMVCAITTLVDYISILLPLKGFCPHKTEEGFSKRPCFKKRKCYKWISFGILFMMTLAIVWNIKVLVTNSCLESKVLCFLMISDQLYSLCGIIAAATFSLQGKSWMEIQNRCCDNLEERKEFGITHLLTSSFCQKFTLRGIIIKVIFLLLYIPFCALLVKLAFTESVFSLSFLLNNVTVLFSYL